MIGMSSTLPAMRLRLAALAVVALAGCSSSGAPASAPSSTRPIRVAINGTVDLTDSAGWEKTTYGHLQSGQLCSGKGGYDDIAAGAQVIVSDDAGHTLQISKLENGYITRGLASCRFTFSAYVLAGKHFYGVEVTHRGVVKEPEAKLGHVALTLG